jgi:hypothetical protein
LECEICGFNYIKIYNLPLSYCDNCFLINYSNELKVKKYDFLKNIINFTNRYINTNDVSFSNINYLLNFDIDEMKSCSEDTLFIVYNTDFLLSEQFNKCNYIFNDYLDCYYFNCNTIKLLANKYDFKISYIKKVDQYIVFKVSKNELFSSSIIDTLLYEDILNDLYEQKTINTFYLNYLYFKNIVQNKIIEKIKRLGYCENNLNENNYTRLFSIF